MLKPLSKLEFLGPMDYGINIGQKRRLSSPLLKLHPKLFLIHGLYLSSQLSHKNPMISISMGQHMTMKQENDSLILYSPLFMQGLSLGLVSPMG